MVTGFLAGIDIILTRYGDKIGAMTRESTKSRDHYNLTPITKISSV
jgi:hypothetical protein